MAAIDDVLAVNPIFVTAATIVINQLILDIDIAPPSPECVSRNCHFIGQQVITPFRAKCAGKSHKRHLDRCGSGGKDFVSSASCVAVQIDENVNAIVHNLIDQLVGGPSAGIVEYWGFAFDLLPVVGVVA